MESQEKPPYREFVRLMLSKAKIKNKKTQEELTTPENMKIFLTAVTHPSHDEENNYQELEFIGDGILKGILGQYILRRFSETVKEMTKLTKKKTSEGILSKIRRYLEQSKTLGEIGSRLGFWDYVLMDEELKKRNKEKTLEDVFEAFIGALVTVIDKEKRMGLGYAFAFEFVKNALDATPIDISFDNLDDPVTRLGELYKATDENMAGGKKPLRWGDAIYKTMELSLPKLEEFPSINMARQGDLIFYISKPSSPGVVYMLNNNRWISVRDLPLMEIQALPDTVVAQMNPGKEIEKQNMWYAGVYGFLDEKGNPINKNLSEKRPDKNLVIQNPSKYQAFIIGQGLAFKQAKAKGTAAKQALDYLKSRGFMKK